MTLREVPATIDLLLAIRVQPMQADDPIDAAILEHVLRQADATVLLLDGVPIAARLAVQQWPGRIIFHALISEQAGRHMTAIVRTFRAWLSAADRRVETTVLSGWAEGARFARLLGFKREGHMPGYDPHGRAHDLWARVR